MNFSKVVVESRKLSTATLKLKQKKWQEELHERMDTILSGRQKGFMKIGTALILLKRQNGSNGCIQRLWEAGRTFYFSQMMAPR